MTRIGWVLIAVLGLAGCRTMRPGEIAEIDKYCREHDLVTEVSRSGMDNSIIDAWCAPKYKTGDAVVSGDRGAAITGSGNTIIIDGKEQR